MPALFTLDVATDPAARRATLRLADRDGRHLAAHEVDLTKLPPATWAAACHTRAHVRRMQRSAPPEQQLADLGAFLGEKLLGNDIARHVISGGVDARTLLLRVPDAPEDPVAVAFAGIPWEIARAPGDARTLLQHNVSLRVAFEKDEAGKVSTVAPRGEPVRVLLVFADPPPTRPLSVRLERERLRDLFFAEILPRRNVEVDVLCHGVTRTRLIERITARAGYHLVHWSGHGHVNQLALPDGTISGEELVALFRDAGFEAPATMLLSACHSGAAVPAKDWASLRAEEGDTKDGSPLAGTALALLRAGVKQVAAMRWDVGDLYARRLARRFYRHLFADEGQHPVDKALALARAELVRDEARKNEYDPVDHATPLLLGAEAVRFAPEKKRSPQMDRQKPKPQPLLTSGSRELDSPLGFVGRGEELTRLFEEWMDRQGGKPVALIQGLAGLGKTSLAAEVVHLGFERFDYILAFQAKGGPLGIEEMFRRIDPRLALVSPTYRERCKANDRAKVFIEPDDGFKGPERYDVLAYNLVEVMTAEQILLVLDNFETNLMVEKEKYGCADPAWERLLEILAERLGETGSRVLLTSRHEPAVLDGKALWIPLGALPMGEAKLYFQNHDALRRLWFGDDDAFALARRILEVSHGHPLILARIADLARLHHDPKDGLVPAGRAALGTALNRIQGEGFRSLPDLFAKVKSEDERWWEYKYLNDVAIGAVDLLIERLEPEGRRLLWLVTRAGEPMPEALLEAVWGSAPQVLLGALCGTGLLTRDKDAAYAFHELVAERAREWVHENPSDRGEKTEAEVWKAFGEWYAGTYDTLIASRKTGSRDAAFEMGRRGIRYLIHARAFGSLMTFASAVATSTGNPALLGQVISDLQAIEVVVADAPTRQARWRLRTSLANALRNAGRLDQALPLYAQAAQEAEGAAPAEAEVATRDADLGVIYTNWGLALYRTSRFDRARETYLRGAEAKCRAGDPRVLLVENQIHALKIDVAQGRAGEALPEIESTLTALRSWWARQERGEAVPEAPNSDTLARVLMNGLDAAWGAYTALARWQSALDVLGERESVGRAIGAGDHAISQTRMKRCGPLMVLGEHEEARAVLEGCLEVFRGAGDAAGEAGTLLALATVWVELGDLAQALVLQRQALALFERLPDPGGRAGAHGGLAFLVDATEAQAHLLAALAYLEATGLDARPWVSALAELLREASDRGERFALPALTALLAAPAFAPLRAFLQERGADLADLQARIDALVEEARARARPAGA